MEPIKFMKPFHEQPEAGRKVIVFMKDGSERTANTCMVYSAGFTGLQWYDMKTRKAINVNEIKGWLPRRER